jgi:hypothetical protein
MMTKVCFAIAENCKTLKKFIKKGDKIIIDIMKWKADHSTNIDTGSNLIILELLGGSVS